MKLKVNTATGMVALVAGSSIMNRKKGVVFGALPKDAGRLIAGKHASPCKDLSEDFEYDEIDVNPESGAVGGMKSANAKKTGDVAAMQKEIVAKDKAAQSQAAEIASLKEQLSKRKP